MVGMEAAQLPAALTGWCTGVLYRLGGVMALSVEAWGRAVVHRSPVTDTKHANDRSATVRLRPCALLVTLVSLAACTCDDAPTDVALSDMSNEWTSAGRVVEERGAEPGPTSDTGTASPNDVPPVAEPPTTDDPGRCAVGQTLDEPWHAYLKSDIPESELHNQYGAGLDGRALPVANPVTGRTIVVDNSAPDDQITIQAAIDGASFGDEIYLPNGVYELKSRNSSYARPAGDYVAGVSVEERDYDEGALLLRSGINIRGESEDGVVLALSETAGAEGVLCALGKHWSVTDVHVMNLTITTMSGFMTYPVRLWNSSYGDGVVNNIVLENVTVEKFARRGFRIETAEDVLLRRCTARETDAPNNGYGFEVYGDNDFGPYESRYITFELCQAIGPNMRHGFIVQDKAHHILIDRCYTLENYFGTIELHAGAEHHVEIRNCVVENPRSVGIKIRSGAGAYNWVHHCTVICVDDGKAIVNETDPNQIEYNDIRPCSGTHVLPNRL